MSIYEKEEGQSPVYMCISTCILGVSGGMLSQEILFLDSETTYGHFQGLCSE